MITIDVATTNPVQLERSHVEIARFADAEAFLEEAYGTSLRLRRIDSDPASGPYLTHARTSVGPLTIDDVYVAGALEAAPDPMNMVIGVWAASGRLYTECDGMASEISRGKITLLSQPYLPYRCFAENLRATTVLLDPTVVASVARGVPRDQLPSVVRFTSFMPVDTQAARLWKDTVTYVATTVLADDAIVTPLVTGHISRLLAAVMLSTFPNNAVTPEMPSDSTDTKPVLLRRAVEFMDANATKDIALADIAEAIHVTPRAVQYMFRRHLDTTPLQYLRRIRLHYAHLELSAADRRRDTVTEIATRWGFGHTGRFAVIYRQVYGQSPHTTLRD